jgi:hypothetical protein
MSLSQDDIITRDLASGERLLWRGSPAKGIRLQPSDALMVPFSLMWGGFAIFWEYSVLHMPTRPPKPESDPSMFMALWGIPFVLIGLYIIVGRFFFDAFARSRTVYAVTNQRVLIITSVWSKEIKSLSLRTLSEMSLSERSDGSGTITFGPVPAFNAAWVPGWPGANKRAAPAFRFVAGARQVHDLIQKAQNL